MPVRRKSPNLRVGLESGIDRETLLGAGYLVTTLHEWGNFIEAEVCRNGDRTEIVTGAVVAHTTAKITLCLSRFLVRIRFRI